MIDSSNQNLSSKTRRAGVILHMTSLPGPYGIGEIGSRAEAFVDRLVDMQISVWQFLPTGPTAFGDSPYQPLSTIAGNELLIDIDNLIALHLLHDDEVSELELLPQEFVDYDALIPIKNRLLGLAASRFVDSSDADLHAEFAVFLERNDSRWLHNYAVFRVLKSLHDERPWPEWRAEFKNRETAALRGVEETESDSILAIKALQFLFFRQWFALHEYARARGVMLFGDLPIYIALDSADAWANRDILMLDEDGRPKAVAGVPPDYFSEDGQLWGNPLYDWAQHEADGYSWWIARLRASLALADLIRIDHFRGFESYWSVPVDAVTARDGAWEQGPGDAIFDAIRAAMGTLPIIAEDLGVITPEVAALRSRQHLSGMRVLQFEVCNAEFDLAGISEISVCYTGTHDNDTIVGWFLGSADETRSQHEISEMQRSVLRFTGGTSETVHTDMINAAFSTAAHLAIAPMQDYLGLGTEARMNTPGVAGGNWRWRVMDTQLTPQFCDTVASMVIASERMISNAN
jgi:4-alpha-glucanotransferase